MRLIDSLPVFLYSSPLTRFLYSSGPPAQGMSLPTVGWAFLPSSSQTRPQASFIKAIPQLRLQLHLSLDCAELVIQANQDRVGLLNHLGYPNSLGSDVGQGWNQGLVYLVVFMWSAARWVFKEAFHTSWRELSKMCHWWVRPSNSHTRLMQVMNVRDPCVTHGCGLSAFRGASL